VKITRTVPQTVDVVAIRCTLPNRYHDEEDDQFLTWPEGAGYDRDKHVLTVVFDLDTMSVRDWPAGATADLHLKVCDEGSYELLAPDGRVVAGRAEEYVPECLPSEYGDYVIAKIGPDGVVKGWHPTARDVEFSFFGGE